MSLTPDIIKEDLEQIGVPEASKLLKEWITHSSEDKVRKEALELLGEIDTGKEFPFFEQLFLSDEDINIRILVGKILNDKYAANKKIYPLLEFTLAQIESKEQKIQAAKLLNSLKSREYNKLIKAYLKETIRSEFRGEPESFPIDLDSLEFEETIPPSVLELCFIILNSSTFTIENNRIVMLNCEGGNLTRTSELLKYNTLSDLKHLSLRRFNIEVMDGLEHLKKLKTLELSNNNIKKLENLGSLEELEELNLSNNKIEIIENVDSLKKLKNLFLDYNSIENISGLGNLQQLEDINLSNNKIKTIENLGHFKSLKRVNLSFNQLDQMTGVEKFGTIRFLYLNNNNIAQIEGLESLSHLEVLNLSHNKIDQITGLESLSNLNKIELSGNRIQKIEGLASLRRLKELYLDGNQIEKVEGLGHIERLVILFLGNNTISDFKQTDLEGLGNMFFYLFGNPLTEESQEEYKKWTRFP